MVFLYINIYFLVVVFLMQFYLHKYLQHELNNALFCIKRIMCKYLTPAETYFLNLYKCFKLTFLGVLAITEASLKMFITIF